MNFVMLNNFEFMRHFNHCFKRWQSRFMPKQQPASESISLQGLFMQATNAGGSPQPQPHSNLTPQNWLAQQAPEDAIVVYISKPSLQIVDYVGRNEKSVSLSMRRIAH